MSQVKVSILMNADGSKQASSSDVIDGATKTKLFSPFSLSMLAGVDAAALRGSLVAAKSGANSDITSLTGLTTALTVAQGGTGATSMGAGAVGTVAQVSGVPTGAIIEYTTGTNGDCVRYADGTQICTFKGSVLVDLTGASGAFFTHGGDFTIAKPFAKPFSVAPKVTHSYQQSAWYGFSQTTTLPTAANWPGIKGFSMASTAATTISFDMIAIGRWF